MGCCKEPDFSYFPPGYTGRDPALLKRLSDEVIGAHKLDKSDPQFPAQFAAALGKTVVHDGRGISNSVRAASTTAQKVIHYLLLGKSPPKLTWELFKAVVIKENPELLQEFREELQAILDGSSLPSQGSAPGAHALFDCFVGNVLALLPFAYPPVANDENPSEFRIPIRRAGGGWERVTYRVVQKIDLSPSWFSAPLPAFILEPQGQVAPPLFLFLGTTYPTGAGCLATLLGDATPFMSVGHAAFLWGKKELALAFEKYPNPHLVGISFGAATLYHVVRAFKDKIGRAQAFVPPGLLPWNRFDAGDVELTTYVQSNDLVSYFGYFPKGSNAKLYHLMPEDGGKKENTITGHIRAFSGYDRSVMVQTSAEHENGRIGRHLLTLTYSILAPALIFIPLFALNIVRRVIYVAFQILILPYTLYKWGRLPPVAPLPTVEVKVHNTEDDSTPPS